MKIKSIKKLLIMLILITIIAIISTNVKATSINPLNIQGLGGSSNQGGSTVNVTDNGSANKTTNTTTNTVSNYKNENLPQTGDASDYVIFLFIAVCAVIGIYAYRRYKNYNI